MIKIITNFRYWFFLKQIFFFAFFIIYVFGCSKKNVKENHQNNVESVSSGNARSENGSSSDSSSDKNELLEKFNQENINKFLEKISTTCHQLLEKKSDNQRSAFITCARQATKIESNDSLYFLLGVTYLKYNNKLLALFYLFKSINNSSNNDLKALSYLYVSRIESEFRKLNKSISYLKESLKFTKRKDVNFELLNLYSMLGQLKNANTIFTDLNAYKETAIKKNQAEPLLIFSQYLVQNKQYDQANDLLSVISTSLYESQPHFSFLKLITLHHLGKPQSDQKLIIDQLASNHQYGSFLEAIESEKK